VCVPRHADVDPIAGELGCEFPGDLLWYFGVGINPSVRVLPFTDWFPCERTARDSPSLERLSQRLNHRPVATMVEEALGIRSADQAQGFADDLRECLVATSARFS